ncbi:MAG: DUF4349 domain-containing protein [Spirosomataceae bacterium]
MKTVFCSLFLGIAVLFSACSSKYSMDNANADSTFVEATAGPLTKVGKNEINRKFVRTADLKFRVKNVADATIAIEQITRQLGGFVTLTDLQSTVNQTTTTEVSADSSLEQMHYTVSNTMTLRVPSTQLDTTLKAITALIDYLDHRTLKADDVALQLVANDLTQQRMQRRVRNVARPLPYQWVIDGQQQADEAKVSNLALQDQLDFSTISLNIYEREKINSILLPSQRDIATYQPSFGSEVLTAMISGWKILKVLILSLIQLWSLVLIAGIGWLLYKRVSRVSLKKL